MTVQYATMTILMFGFGNLFGMGFGGYLGSYLYRIDKRYPALLAGAVAILACFPLWTLLNCIENSTPFLTVAIVSSVAGVGSGMTGPIIKATLQNVTVPQARGQAFALFNTFDDLGKGLGPAFIAILISRLGGRTPAFNVGTCGWLVCGLFNLCIFWTVERDERNVQEFLVASQLKKQCASQGDSGYGSVCLADDNPLDISGTQ
jgi:predicted MFS family arabinose efflux permease